MLQNICVLHIISALNRGGIETWLMYLLRLQQPEVQFDFAVFQKGVMDDEAKSLGAVIHYLPFRRPTILRHQKELKQIFQENHYDVIHYHGSSFSGIVMKIAAECGIPVRIDHAHNTRRSGKRFFVNTVKEIYRQWVDIPQIDNYATNLLACSQEAGQFYFGKLWEHKKPHKMVYCGIPLEYFDTIINPNIRKKLCEHFKIDTDAIVIGTLGRLSYQKNYEFLINIFAELAKRDKRYILFIGGEGELRSNLEKQIRKLNLQDRVFLPGTVSNVPELLCQLFDVFVLPSRFEGFGIVLIESIAAGLDIVCSDIITLDLQKYLSDKMTLLNLQDSISAWCDAIEAGIQKRVSPQEGVSQVQKTPFEINQSMTALLACYRTKK